MNRRSSRNVTCFNLIDKRQSDNNILIIESRFRQQHLCYVHHAAEPTDSVTCPVCEKPMQRQRLRHKWVKTLCGDVLVSRWYYRCQRGHNCFPWDYQQELRGRYSKNVAEAICKKQRTPSAYRRLSARLDFREACDELSHHGIEVSHTTLQQTTESWGSGVNVPYWIEEQALEKQQRWYISCDGCHTHSPDGWHETKVGCVYRDYPQHGPNAETHAISDSMRYVATRDNAQVFGGQWFSLAVKSGIYRQGEDDAEIVAICDGAEWIWKLVEEYFPTAVQIIDYPHAQGHLWECAKSNGRLRLTAKQAFGEHNGKQVARWVKTTENYLFDGNIKQVGKRIRQLKKVNPEFRE